MPPAGYNSSLSALTGQLPAAAAIAPGNHPGYTAAANFNALQQAPPVSTQLPGVADVAASHGANMAAAATALELNRRASTGQLPYVPPAVAAGELCTCTCSLFGVLLHDNALMQVVGFFVKVLYSTRCALV